MRRGNNEPGLNAESTDPSNQQEVKKKGSNTLMPRDSVSNRSNGAQAANEPMGSTMDKR